MTPLESINVERAVPETAHAQVSHAFEHEGGQEADHPEVAEAVREVEGDLAVRHGLGHRAEDLVLLVDIPAGGDEAKGDGEAYGLAHEQRDGVEHRLCDRGMRLRVEQFQPRGLYVVSRREVLDQHAPLAAARAENDRPVRLQMPGQRDAKERRLARRVLTGEPISRPLVPGVRIPSGPAQKGDQGVVHDAPAPDSSSVLPRSGHGTVDSTLPGRSAPGSSSGSAANSPNPKWLP